MSTIFKPRKGSIAERVLAFLQANPDEELASGDIAAKFDLPAKNVTSVLALSLANGLLVRSKRPNGAGYVYRLPTFDEAAAKLATVIEADEAAGLNDRPGAEPTADSPLLFCLYEDGELGFQNVALNEYGNLVLSRKETNRLAAFLMNVNPHIVQVAELDEVQPC